jgi:2,4-dienoyl-CoA reductase-like NADH-dependent reductase (Old Yellow Enzyme family)
MNLFTPLRIKDLELKNRIVLPPMATEASGADGAVQAASVDYYGRMAGRGMGLLVVEHNFIAPEGRASPGQMAIAGDPDIDGHRRIVQAIHAAGAKAAVQVSHSGSNRAAAMPGPIVGPSPVVHPTSGLLARELDPGEIAAIVIAFGMAAARGAQAGYDLVEIHAAHGYLLGQFLSPLTNRRGDRYGGTPANRRRLLLEVIEEARGRLPGDYPLMVRLGLSDTPPGSDLHAGGITVAEGIETARALAGAGIGLLDVSGGMCGSRPAGLGHEAYFLPWLQALRPAVSLPLVLTGGVRTPAAAAAVVAAESADLVGVGRALAADPHWVDAARQALGC